MKLVQVLYSGLGGHSSVGFSLIEADTEKKYKHIIIFYGIEEIPESSINKCKALGVEYFFVKKKRGIDLKSQKKVNAILRNVLPHIILLHSVNLILPVYKYRLKHKTRLIAVEHQSNHLKTKREWIWSFLLMRFADKVVFLTNLYNTQIKKKLGLLYNAKKVKVINNGININLFKPAQLNNIENDSVLKVGMLARLMNTKDHKTLIKAFELLNEKYNGNKQIQLYIAGDGETMNELKEISKKTTVNSRIFFLGMISEAESAEFIKGLDIYIHASLGETMSTSIMQAMACAKPIIASDVKGINNMLEDNATGLLVPVKNETMLCQSINELLKNDSLQNRLGNAAFQYARDFFSNELMFKKYEEIFK